MLSSFAPLLALCAAPPPVADPPRPFTDAPLVIRAAPLNAIRPRLGAFVKAAGTPERAKAAEAFLKTWLDGDAIGPIDRARPSAVFVTDVAAKGPTLVLVAPVTSEAKARAFLEGLKILGPPDADGVHALTIPGDDVPSFARFAHGHAFVAAGDKALLKSKPADPATYLPKESPRLVSATLRFARLPVSLRKGVEKTLADALTVPGADDPMNHVAQFGGAAAKWAKDLAGQVFDDGDETTAVMELDPKTSAVSLEWTLSARPGSALATAVEDFAKGDRTFATNRPTDPAFRFQTGFPLAKPVADAAGALLDGIFDPADDAGRFFRATFSALRFGVIDWVAELHGPDRDGLFTMIQGSAVRDGGEMLAAMRKVFDGKVKFETDVGRIGKHEVHRADVLSLLDEEQAPRNFVGDKPTHFVTTARMRVEASGPKGLEDLRKFLDAPKTRAPQILVEASVGRLLRGRFVQKQADELAAAKAAFGRDTPDRVRLAVEGGANLKLTMRVDAAVIRFLGTLGDIKGKAGG